MKILCSSCQNEIHLDDTKVPEGVFKIKCPKCGKLVTAHRPAPATQASTSAAAAGESEKVSPAVEAYIKKEIAAAKNEIMGVLQALLRSDSGWPGSSGNFDVRSGDPLDKRVLNCQQDSATLDAISSTLRSMGYQVENTTVAAEAVKKLESSIYQIVIVNYALSDDKDGGRKIIGRINGWKPLQRRQTFIVLVSPHVKTSDANQAFLHGVNLTVHEADIANLEALIREAQRLYQQLYHTFYRALEKGESLL